MSLFITHVAKCRHGSPLAVGCDECPICEIEREILTAKPPFNVRVVDERGSSLQRDAIYTVLVVVEKGGAVTGASAPMVLLKAKDGDFVFPHGYAIDRFVKA